MNFAQNLSGSSLIENCIRELWDIVKGLLDAKILVHQGATVYYQESEIEYQMHINLGPSYSRASVIEKKIHSYMLRTVCIRDVIDVWGFGIIRNESLKELGIIQLEKDVATISFGEMLRKVESELVVLTIRKKLPVELRDKLITIHFSKNARVIDDVKETYFEVALDYANLWLTSFNSFNVKNIIFNLNLEIPEESIEYCIPEPLKKEIRMAARAILNGSRKAVNFLNIISKGFLTFEKEEMVNALQRMIHVEPPDRVEIVNIIPRMEAYEIAEIGYPITLPGRVTTHFRTNIDAREVTLRGKIILDLNIFRQIIRDIVNKIEGEARRLKII